MEIKASLEKVNEAIGKIREVGTAIIKNSRGSVCVKDVEADFSFDQSTEILTVTITNKPWLVSKSYVEEEIRKFFS